MPPRFPAAPLRLLVFGLLLALTAAAGLRANSDERTWILEGGETFRAELVRYDEASGQVTLRFKQLAEERAFEMYIVSTMVRAWLDEW